MTEEGYTTPPPRKTALRASCEIVPRPKRPKTSHIGPVRGDSWMTGPDGSAEPSGPVVRRKERVMETPTLGRIEAEYLNGVRSGNVRKKRLRKPKPADSPRQGQRNVLHRPRSQVRTEPRHTSPNHQPALETPTGPTRPRRCSGAPVTMFGRTPRKCALRPRDRSYLPCSGRQVRPYAKRALHHRSQTCAPAPPA